jgi:hypothetical protein
MDLRRQGSLGARGSMEPRRQGSLGARRSTELRPDEPLVESFSTRPDETLVESFSATQREGRVCSWSPLCARTTTEILALSLTIANSVGSDIMKLESGEHIMLMMSECEISSEGAVKNGWTTMDSLFFCEQREMRPMRTIVEGQRNRTKHRSGQRIRRPTYTMVRADNPKTERFFFVSNPQMRLPITYWAIVDDWDSIVDDWDSCC